MSGEQVKQKKLYLDPKETEAKRKTNTIKILFNRIKRDKNNNDFNKESYLWVKLLLTSKVKR